MIEFKFKHDPTQVYLSPYDLFPEEGKAWVEAHTPNAEYQVFLQQQHFYDTSRPKGKRETGYYEYPMVSGIRFSDETEATHFKLRWSDYIEETL